MTSSSGFSYIETLVGMTLFLLAVLFVGRMNMTSVQLIGKGKINQRATLALLEKIDQLRSLPIQELSAGTFEEDSGMFLVQWRVQENTPYFGTLQIHCRVVYKRAGSVIAESIFYRSE